MNIYNFFYISWDKLFLIATQFLHSEFNKIFKFTYWKQILTRSQLVRFQGREELNKSKLFKKTDLINQIKKKMLLNIKKC